MKVLIFIAVILQSVFWIEGSDVPSNPDGPTLSRNLFYPTYPGLYPSISGYPSVYLPPQMFLPANTMLGQCNPYNPIGCQIMGLYPNPISTGTSSTGQPIMPNGGFFIPITSTTTTTVTEEIIDGKDTQ
ncbi:hypothetical protein O3M35_000233 [Rhynocoris fuscipes]|uniref:Uncharacterized protein n=1 Tax=Rhynocoris fuscipes TaxID=488301 RepID=A0AAW1DKT9_9HEMI